MRMKHGSGQGLAASAKPRLLAAFTAVAMMFATAVPALMPQNASADDGIGDGATCSSQNISMGAPNVEGKNNVGKDDDVATWVGGNMYLGAPLDNTINKYGLNESSIDATYAVEAEGLTLINGKLLSNATKKSWEQNGFRFGVVGFGSQFRAAAGSDSLVIGGNSSNLSVPANVSMKDFFGTDVNALAFDSRGRAWIGMDTAYNAKIAGAPSARLRSDDTKVTLPPVGTGYTRVFVKGNASSKLYAWEGNNKFTGDWGGQTLQRACGDWRYTDVLNNGSDFNAKPNNNDGNGDNLPAYRVVAASAAAKGNSVMIMPGETPDTAYGAPSCGESATSDVTTVIVPSKNNAGNPTKPSFTYKGRALEPSRNLGQWYVFEVPITGAQFDINVYGDTNVSVPGTSTMYTIWNGKAESGDPVALNHLDADLYSVYSRANDSKVIWNAENPLKTVQVNSMDENNTTKQETKDYSGYTQKIQNDSANFANVAAADQIDATTGFAPANSDYYRNKYEASQDTYIKLKFGDKTEKLITFDGENATGDTVVFRLKASDLTNVQDGVTTNGVDFEFKNIGDKTVIVNVVNDDGSAADATNVIQFNTGWRFWWGEGKDTIDISNGYYDNASEPEKNGYSKAAQSILWNFPRTSKLTINGGQVNKGQATEWKINRAWKAAANAEVHDDPSAAMIGSIMVPNGSFEDHVSTNGRVYVGGDFMMYNPTPVEGTDIDGGTASVIDMDQERHNFPWHGALSTSCAAIGWTKVAKNQSGSYEKLPGTSWKLYGTLAAAEAGAPTLLPGAIVDNNISTGDANSIAGEFTINNLKRSATYYIQEANAPNGYKVNPYIYQIKTGENAETYTAISKVYKIENGKAEEITSTSEAEKLLNGNNIINEKDDVSISWGKKSSEDDSAEPTALPGSKWTLTDAAGNKYTITDNATRATGVQIWYNGADKSGQSLGTFNLGTELQLTSKTTPAGASSAVSWTSSDSQYVQVSRTGKVFLSAYNPTTNGFVTITATSDDNPDVHASVTLKVESVTPTKFEIQHDGQAVTSLDMNVGEKEQLTAIVEPSTLIPVWSTSNSNVATVQNGQITAKAEGTVEITATVGTEVKTVTVRVTDTAKTVIYVKSNLVTNDKYQYIITNLDNWSLNHNHTLSQSEYAGYYSTTIQSEGNAFRFQLWDGSDKYYKPNGVGQLQIDGQFGKDWYSPAGTTALTIDLSNNAYIGTPKVQRNQVIQPAPAQPEAARTAPIEMLAAPRPEEADAEASVQAAADTDAADSTQPSYTQDQDGRTGMFRLDGVPEGTYTLQESKAPDGFLVNPQVYTVKIENGEVTWNPDNPSSGFKWIPDTPTKVEWDKVDAGYPDAEFDKWNPIAGSVWELEKFTPNGDNGAYVSVQGYDNITDCVPDSDSSCSQTVDKNNAAGKFRLVGLNNGRYRLHEKSAPDGYTKSDAYYYFDMDTSNPSKFVIGTVAFDSTSGKPSGNVVTDSTMDVPNHRDLGTVDWTKVSSEALNGTPLAGAEWKIRFKPEGENTSFGDYYTVIDCTSGTCDVPEKPSQPAWTYDRDATLGKFNLKGLEWGEYEFYESKAPDGYYPSDKTYKFTVSKDNLSGITISVDGATTLAAGNKIPNTPGFELPSTGGEGNTLIVLVGFALTAISMLGYAVATRKRV